MPFHVGILITYLFSLLLTDLSTLGLCDVVQQAAPVFIPNLSPFFLNNGYSHGINNNSQLTDNLNSHVSPLEGYQFSFPSLDLQLLLLPYLLRGSTRNGQLCRVTEAVIKLCKNSSHQNLLLLTGNDRLVFVLFFFCFTKLLCTTTPLVDDIKILLNSALSPRRVRSHHPAWLVPSRHME